MTPEDVDYLLNIIRQGTTKWDGRAKCLKRARKRVLVRQSKKGKPVYKYFWQCATCRDWFKDVDSMEVDHIIEIGPYKGDLHEYAERVYCSQENLAALCVVCHLKKTMKYNSARSRWKRKVRP